MPIYEFACTSCGAEFERLRPMSRLDDPADCPQCDGEGQRHLSVFASFSSGANGEVSAIAGGGGGCCGGGGGGGGCACSRSA